MHITVFDIKGLTFCDFDKELKVGKALVALRGNPAITSSGHVLVEDVDAIRGCHMANYSRPIVPCTARLCVMLRSMNQAGLVRSLAAVCFGFTSIVASAQLRHAEPPLHTSGHDILDTSGHRVRLTSVNWYGFDQQDFVAGGLDHAPLATIVKEIVDLGVNSVRLPWANETVERNPQVPDYAVKANPQFRGRHAMEVMDAVVRVLADAHIMVVLDNHVSRADWCCNETDGNGLWYNAEYPDPSGLRIGRLLFAATRASAGLSARTCATNFEQGGLGRNDPKLDWHAAAERGGNAVLTANPLPANHGGGPGLLDQLRRSRQTSGALENR